MLTDERPSFYYQYGMLWNVLPGGMALDCQ